METLGTQGLISAVRTGKVRLGFTLNSLDKKDYNVEK